MKLNVSAQIPPRKNIGGLNPATMAVDKPEYPQVTLESADNLNLPKSGTLTLEYKKIREEINGKDEDERYACTLEVHKLIEAKGKGVSAPSKSNTSASDALDKLARNKAKEKAEGSAAEEAGESAEEEASEGGY